jgi:hypothetical protein
MDHQGVVAVVPVAARKEPVAAVPRAGLEVAEREAGIHFTRTHPKPAGRVGSAAVAEGVASTTASSFLVFEGLVELVDSAAGVGVGTPAEPVALGEAVEMVEMVATVREWAGRFLVTAEPSRSPIAR